jgi:hypothetical protein
VRRDQVIFFYKQGREGKKCFFRRGEFWDEGQNLLFGIPDQPDDVIGCHDCCCLQGKVGHRIVFKGAQAVTSREDLRGNFCQRPKDADLGGTDCMLLIKYLQLRSTFSWSLSNLVALLRQQLFVYRDLWTWIDAPFQSPPQLEFMPEQLALIVA